MLREVSADGTYERYFPFADKRGRRFATHKLEPVFDFRGADFVLREVSADGTYERYFPFAARKGSAKYAL